MEIELNREYPLAGEKELIEEMVKITTNRMSANQGALHRGQHAKSTGCVRGVFTTRNYIPDDLRHGIFSQEKKSYLAIVRFSNSSETIASDTKGDARGISIKLLNVEDESATLGANNLCQDFLMVNHPVFPFATPEEFVKLFQLRDTPLVGDPLAMAWLALFHPHHLKIGADIIGKIVSSPLEMKYWSCSPYWLGGIDLIGGHAVKYSVVPKIENKSSLNDLTYMPEDYLSQALARFLRTQEAVFDFHVQLQTDPIKMPIEDVSVEWDEKISKPIPLATLTISKQDVESPMGIAFTEECETMSFSPWHALAEHRPMGGINRMRQAVYLASQKRRNKNNEPET